MSDYTSREDLFMGVTPGGSFYTVQDDTEEFGRQFLHRLLTVDQMPPFNLDIVQELSGLSDEIETLEFVHLLQDAGFIYGQESSQPAPISPCRHHH